MKKFIDIKNKTWTKDFKTLIIGIFIIFSTLSIPFLIIGFSKFFDLYIEYLNN